MRLPCPLLTSVWNIGLCQNTQWGAGAAGIAVGAIGKQAAASKTLGHKVRVDLVVDQVTGGCNLRARNLVLQIAARIGRRGVKLYGVKW